MIKTLEIVLSGPGGVLDSVTLDTDTSGTLTLRQLAAAANWQLDEGDELTIRAGHRDDD